MNFNKLTISLVTAALCLNLVSTNSFAQSQSTKIEVSGSEDIKANLSKLDNKVITVVLSSEKEVTGKVHNVSEKLLHLEDLSGKDYFDAVIKIDSIQAIIFKARG